MEQRIKKLRYGLLAGTPCDLRTPVLSEKDIIVVRSFPHDNTGASCDLSAVRKTLKLKLLAICKCTR